MNTQHAPRNQNHDRSASPSAPAAPMAATGRYHVMQPVHREGRDKPFWHRVGTAFENAGKNGGPPSITVRLDSLPLQGELVLFAVTTGEDREDAE
jgi:hypothetical protein